MAGFGGAVKLTGESEYRTALKNITQNLREVSSQLQLNTARYDSNDKSVQDLAKQEEALNKIYKTQEGEVGKLRTAYESFSRKVEDQAKAHKELEDKYKTEKTELERIGKELGTTSKEYQQQKEKVDSLEKSLIKSRQENDNNRNALSKMGTALNKAETDLINTAKEMDKLGDETKQTSAEVKNAGDGFTVFKGMLADLASKAVTTAINGMKQLGGAVIDLGKQALNSYAEYEQLVGGVETLFKDSAGIVQGYAEKAYKTAGLSANQYMETVTSFSASLLQGLNGDTAKTAKIADMAIIDMADNANKMGTSMEMIQNAYQGFAKQNYTMLDNLKLGYGGTKTEMVRLLNDSKTLNHEIENLDNITFDQIVTAIHAVQENMGITGTTAKEASDTIQGSVASMKSAWQNLLTGIADENADFGQLVDNFVDSVITAGENIVPRVKKIVEGVKKLVSSIINDVFPKLKKEIPELKPLIEVFEWFVKNKGTVINAVKLIVGAFAVKKIMDFTKSISDGAKGLMDWVKSATLATTATTANTTAQVANTTAQVAGTGATGALTVATNLLNKAWQANPIGLVVTAVMGLIGAYNLLKGKNEELTEAEKAQQEALKAQADTIQQNQEEWDKLSQAKQDAIDVGMSEITHYKKLYDELNTIVDANGKVKEGYEKRADFITTTLADALGVEIELIDGQVQGMEELRNSIDQVIEKKKAQVILDSQEELYTEALNKKGEALRTLADIEGQINDKKEERKGLEDQLTQKEKERQEYWDKYGRYNQQIEKEIANLNGQIQKNDEVTASLKDNYSKQEELVAQYAYNIGLYEQNMALAHEGRYDEMSQVNWNYVQEYKNADDAKQAMLQDDVTATKKYIDVLKSIRTDANASIIDAEIKKNEDLLAEQEKALQDYNDITYNELKDNNKTWLDNASTVLSKLTDKNIEFKDLGNNQVQYYEDGIAKGAPMLKQEAQVIMAQTLAEFDKKAEAEGAGKDVITGFTNGTGNMSLQNTAFATARNFADNILSTLKTKLGIASPSKETKKMGQYLLEGLGIGMESEEKSILSQVANLGKSIISTFDNSIDENLGLNLSSQIQSGIPANINNTTSAIRKANMQDSPYNTMLLAFQDALASMKIELDDEEAGRFVRKTVENAIYT